MTEDWNQIFRDLVIKADEGDEESGRMLTKYWIGRLDKNQDMDIMKDFYLERAKSPTNQWSQTYLGYMYYHGRGVIQDFHEAYKWYKLAADQGNAAAQNNIAHLYATGRGVTQDFHEVYKWFKLAADQGDSTAQYNLGCSYEFGQGFPQDIYQAYKWYKVAANQDQDHRLSRVRLNAMCKDLNNISLLINSDISINERPTDDWTFLHLWSNEDNKEIIKILLEKGANPFIKDKEGETCLDQATQENKMIIESYVLPPSKEKFRQLSPETQKNMIMWCWIANKLEFYWGLKEYIYRFLE